MIQASARITYWFSNEFILQSTNITHIIMYIYIYSCVRVCKRWRNGCWAGHPRWYLRAYPRQTTRLDDGKGKMSALECKMSDRFLFVIYWRWTCGIFHWMRPKDHRTRAKTKSEWKSWKYRTKFQFCGWPKRFWSCSGNIAHNSMMISNIIWTK